MPLPTESGSPKIGLGAWNAMVAFVNAIEQAVSQNVSALGTKAPTLIATTQQAGAVYTLGLADAGTVVEFTSATAVTLTIPPNSTQAFAVGTSIVLRQYGAGVITVTPGAGVTVRSRGSALKTGGQYAEAALTKRATDEWVLTGDVTA